MLLDILRVNSCEGNQATEDKRGREEGKVERMYRDIITKYKVAFVVSLGLELGKNK